MIILKDRIASGKCRDCWVHPVLTDRCIKTSNNGMLGQEHNESDFRFSAESLKQDLIFDYIPKVYDWIETDHGVGLVFERIMDSDGKTSKTFLDEIESQKLAFCDANRLVADIECKVIQDRLFIRDLHLNNIVLRRCLRDQLSAVIVDGYADFDRGFKSRVRKAVPVMQRLRVKKTFHDLRRSIEDLFSAPLRSGNNTFPELSVS